MKEKKMYHYYIGLLIIMNYPAYSHQMLTPNSINQLMKVVKVIAPHIPVHFLISSFSIISFLFIIRIFFNCTNLYTVHLFIDLLFIVYLFVYFR